VNIKQCIFNNNKDIKQSGNVKEHVTDI